MLFLPILNNVTIFHVITPWLLLLKDSYSSTTNFIIQSTIYNKIWPIIKHSITWNMRIKLRIFLKLIININIAVWSAIISNATAKYDHTFYIRILLAQLHHLPYSFLLVRMYFFDIHEWFCNCFPHDNHHIALHTLYHIPYNIDISTIYDNHLSLSKTYTPSRLDRM